MDWCVTSEKLSSVMRQGSLDVGRFFHSSMTEFALSGILAFNVMFLKSRAGFVVGGSFIACCQIRAGNLCMIIMTIRAHLEQTKKTENLKVYFIERILHKMATDTGKKIQNTTHLVKMLRFLEIKLVYCCTSGRLWYLILSLSASRLFPKTLAWKS